MYLVVSNDKMDLQEPLFKESLSAFLQRYEKMDAVRDEAVPKLKAGIKPNIDLTGSDEQGDR
jgi:hypothetical protein